MWYEGGGVRNFSEFVVLSRRRWWWVCRLLGAIIYSNCSRVSLLIRASSWLVSSGAKSVHVSAARRWTKSPAGTDYSPKKFPSGGTEKVCEFWLGFSKGKKFVGRNLKFVQFVNF